MTNEVKIDWVYPDVIVCPECGKPIILSEEDVLAHAQAHWGVTARAVNNLASDGARARYRALIEVAEMIHRGETGYIIPKGTPEPTKVKAVDVEGADEVSESANKDAEDVVDTEVE